MLERLQAAINRVQGLSAYATYKEKLTNTFGLVVECDAPRCTSGTDLIQTIKLVDESCPEGVALCIFAKEADTMPHAVLGDVLELRNVVVQFWHDRPQLFAKMSKPHCFGFLLYRLSSSAAAASEAEPLQLWNTTQDSHYAAERLPQLHALRGQAAGHAAGADAGLLYLRRIKDLAPPDDEDQRPACVDMRVRVLAIDKRRASQEVILYVWDATDAKPVCASLQMRPSAWKGTELRAPAPRRHTMPLVSEAPNLQVLQDLPPIGTALPVVMDPGAVPSTGLPQVGDWVKIKVVGVAAVQGQWQVVFGKPSRLTQSQPSQEFETFYQARLANQDTSEWPHDLTQVKTSCSIPSLPRMTIRQVLLQAAKHVSGPFRVQVRLIGHLPQELPHWCKMHPREEGADEEPMWEWAAHLWLEDATGDLRALLLGGEGTKLLGIPAQCLSDVAVVQELRTKLESLSTVDEDGGVWMDAALTPLYAAQPCQQQQVEEAQQQQQQQQQHGEQQQAAGGEQRLQLAPFEREAGAPQQQEQPRQDEKAVQPQQPEQQQHLQVGPPAAALPPVFVLHDAVLRSEDAPGLDPAGEDDNEEGQGDEEDVAEEEGDEEEEEEEEEELEKQQQQQQQQGSHGSLHTNSPARAPPPQAEASPLTGRKRRHR